MNIRQILSSDLHLIEQIQTQRDSAAAEMLVERYYKTVYKEIWMKIADEELVKDLTQETFISVLQGIDGFDNKKASFKTWILHIAKNKVIDYYRSRQNHENMLTQSIDGVDKEDKVCIEEQIISKLRVEELWDTMQTKSTMNGKIFVMKVFEGYAFREIAEYFQMSESAVKSRYYGFIEKLRKELSES